jgi:succinate-acetate transporter protein
VVFISLAVLFFLLTAGELTGNSTITLITGYEGIFTGLSTVYVELATVNKRNQQKRHNTRINPN